MDQSSKKNILFVDDELNVLQGLKRMLRGMRGEWNMAFVDSGVKALEALQKNRFDIIVSDMRMPGMDGAELLSRVMKEHPEVIRIVLSGHSDKEMILKSVRSAQQYLSKPCDAETLKKTISRAVALRDLLVQDCLKRIVSQLDTLPSLPKLYEEIMTEMQSEEPSMQRVGEIIAKDMGMTAKILQLVNSAFFGMPRHISNPQQAVNLLGLETIKALVLSVQIFSQFEGKKIPPKFLDSLWRHSMTSGSFTRAISKKVGIEKNLADDAFLAALLHDIGKLILLASFPDSYKELIRRSGQEKVSIRKLEEEKFGTTHAEVGAYLMGLWGLPDVIVEAIAFHHKPASCPVEGVTPLLIVHVASALEHALSPGEEIEIQEKLDEEYLARHELDSKLDMWKQICENAIQ